MDLKEKIRSIPDFPIKGVLFRDVTTLLKDPEGYHELVETIAASLRDRKVDLVVGPEARGFVIGAALAQERSRLQPQYSFGKPISTSR